MYNLQLTLRCPQCASTYAKHTVWLMSIHRVCRVPCQAGFVSSQLWISPRLLLSVTSGLQCKSVPSFHSGLLSLVWVDGWCIKQLSSKISYNTLDSLFSQPPPPISSPTPFRLVPRISHCRNGIGSKAQRRGLKWREGSSLGFVEIFIGQGWLVKLNIYADLTCLFNLCLGKYVSKVITFYVPGWLHWNA